MTNDWEKISKHKRGDRIDPALINAWCSLLNVRRTTDDEADVEALQDAMEAGNRRATPIMGRVIKLQNQGDFDAALELLDSALSQEETVFFRRVFEAELRNVRGK